MVASPLSLAAVSLPTTLLILSDSLSTGSLSFPSPVNPAESLTVSSEEWSKIVATLTSEGVVTKEVEFVEKTAEACVPSSPRLDSN